MTTAVALPPAMVALRAPILCPGGALALGALLLLTIGGAAAGSRPSTARHTGHALALSSH